MVTPPQIPVSLTVSGEPTISSGAPSLAPIEKPLSLGLSSLAPSQICSVPPDGESIRTNSATTMKQAREIVLTYAFKISLSSENYRKGSYQG